MSGGNTSTISTSTFLHKMLWIPIDESEVGTKVKETTTILTLEEILDINRLRAFLIIPRKSNEILIHVNKIFEGYLGFLKSISQEFPHIHFFIGPLYKARILNSKTFVYFNVEDDMYYVFRKKNIARNILSVFPYKKYESDGKERALLRQIHIFRNELELEILAVHMTEIKECYCRVLRIGSDVKEFYVGETVFTKVNGNVCDIIVCMCTLVEKHRHSEIESLWTMVNNSDSNIYYRKDTIVCTDFNTALMKHNNISNLKQRVYWLNNRIRLGGTVVITGGSGALGTLFADFLSDHHPDIRILLLSRSGKNKLVSKKNVVGVKCDVSCLEELTPIMNTITDLTGVIHAAGILRDGSFVNLGKSEFESVYATKVYSAKNLDYLTKMKDI